jgi:hypothetical protein
MPLFSHSTARPGTRRGRPAWAARLLVALTVAAPSARAQTPVPGPSATPAPTPAPMIVAPITGAAPAPTPSPGSSGANGTFHPPLCLEDGIALVARSRALLEAAVGAPSDERLGAAVRMIGSARDYCEFLDNRHSSLGAYQWVRLASQPAPARGKIEGPARLPSRVRNVSVLSFEAGEGDVWVDAVTVTDDTGAQVRIPVGRAISRDLPWTVVVHLPRPMTVCAVSTRRWTWGVAAELKIFAGLGQGPDFGRHAVLLLEESRQAIGEERLEAAIASLDRAKAEMTLFRKWLDDQARPHEAWFLGRTRRFAGQRPEPAPAR